MLRTSPFGRDYPIPKKPDVKRYCPKFLVVRRKQFHEVPDFAQPSCRGGPAALGGEHRGSAGGLLQEQIDSSLPHHRPDVEIPDTPRLPARPDFKTECHGMQADARRHIGALLRSGGPGSFKGRHPGRLPEFTLVVRWPHSQLLPAPTPALALALLSRYGDVTYLGRWRGSANALVLVFASLYAALRLMACQPLCLGRTRLIVDWYFTHMKGKANQASLMSKMPPERVYKLHSPSSMKRMEYARTQDYVAHRLKEMCAKMSYNRAEFNP